jgi:hypothetical protein
LGWLCWVPFERRYRYIKHVVTYFIGLSGDVLG